MLDSLLKESDLIHEIIILENYSPDRKETKLVVNKFKHSHKKVKITFISNKYNAGFAVSCNKAAKMAKTKYVLFLNPDTELKKNSIKILLEHAKKNGADIIGGKAVNYKKQPHESVVRKPGLLIGLFEFSNLGKLFRVSKAHKLFYYEDINILTSETDIKVDAVSGAYLLIERSAFNKLGGFDENFFMYLEDVDLGKRANDARMKVIFCPHSVIWHVGGASSKNKYKIRHQAWFDSRKYYFKKHFGLLTNLIIQPLFTIEEFLLKLIKSL